MEILYERIKPKDFSNLWAFYYISDNILAINTPR